MSGFNYFYETRDKLHKNHMYIICTFSYIPITLLVFLVGVSPIVPIFSITPIGGGGKKFYIEN